MSNRVLLIGLLASLSLRCFCQGYVNYDYLPSSSFKDKEGNKYGSGDLQRISGKYTIPLSKSINEKMLPTAWNMTLSASYGWMDNKEMAKDLNPDKILNTSITVSHLRPLSERWSLIASLGCGIYAAPDEIRWQSLLANGAFIFAYRLRDNLSIGIGAGLTNSYGVPVIMPMGYLNWRTNGQYEVLINMIGIPKVQVSKQVGKSVRMELTAMEIDGMAAVVRADGSHKLYSTTIVRSGLNASVRLSDKTSIYTGVGGIWFRSAKITDRKFKSFYKNLGDNKYRFAPSSCFSIGLRYGF